jgi:F-type H+-transporting ATPase subunit a
MAENALNPNHLFGHVQDATYFDVPRALSQDGRGHVYLPQPFAKTKLGPNGKPVLDHNGQPKYQALWEVHSTSPIVKEIVQPFDLTLTRFMVIEVAVALIMCVLFMGLARKIRNGRAPKGRLWNMLEAFLLYFRDKVIVPCVGPRDASRFAPLVWSVFFFVLGCNLMGLLPWVGSPTASLAVTGALALVVFVYVIGSSVSRLGFWGFWKAQVPHMDLPKPVAVFLVPMIFGIELFTLFVKHFVLAVRLLANMIGGHVVLAVLLAFITLTAGSFIYWAVMPASVVGSAALSLLELLFAFIQAFIFAFLTALFVGMAVHPH